MANIFDQFDEPAGNVFDQFDEKPKASAKPESKAVQIKQAARELTTPTPEDQLTGVQKLARSVALGAAAPAGVLAQAAIGGTLAGLEEPANDLKERLYNAAWGAGIAATISGAVKLAGYILGPKDPQVVEYLKSIGVKLSPAQEMGPGLQKAEQALESIPLGGQQVSNVREAARESFVRASAQMPLTVIGQRLADDAPAGHAAIKDMAEKVSAFYDDLLPKLTTKLDATFADDVAIARTASRLDTASSVEKKKFETIIRNDILRRFGSDGTMPGLEMKAAEETLTKEIGAYARGTADERKLADALDDVRTGLRNLVMRSNPNDAPDLAKANLAYAMSRRVVNAAATAIDGKFTPKELFNATVRRSAVSSTTAAKGESLMQGMAEKAENVIGSKLPNSATAERQMMLRLALGSGLGGGALAAGSIDPRENPFLAAGLGAAGLGALYSPIGRAALRNAGQLGRLGAPIGAATAGFGGSLLMGGQQ